VDLNALAVGYELGERTFEIGKVEQGSVQLNEASARFTPSENFAGLARFEFTVKDAEGNSLTRPMNIRVVKAE
jgi:hypothetical protein